MLEIGSLVDGKYKILNKVGQGGMSVVYLAMNEKANKQWAVKEVRKDGVLDFEAVKQGLVAETDILKRLDHPGLPSIIDVIDTDESFIIIMDYIQGNSLNKALEEYGAQPQENVIEWAKQLCDVLGYLHTRTPPIIYRDMKPANIMLKPDGNVTLIDFGTAREYKEKNLADTTCLGTIGYAAPEQFGGMGQTDARTDIYCLGATLYHLVTGMNPCEPPYEIRPIRDINPALSSGLERIILKCTQRDPNDRYQSAAELMYALEHYEEIDDKYKKKQKKKLAAFLAPVVLALGFAGVSIWGYTAAEQKLTANYDYILAQAAAETDEAAAVAKYYEAITTDPTRTDAYLGNSDFAGLISCLIKDDVLNADENGYLQQLKGGLNSVNARGYGSTVNVLEALQTADPEGYAKVCYEIGETYLFYYDINVDKDKYEAAARWFNGEVKERYPVAKIYSDIADCLTNIAGYSKKEKWESLYQEYETLWTKLTALNDDAEGFEDDLKLRVWGEIVNIVNNPENIEGFSKFVEKQTIVTLLNGISERAKAINSTFMEQSVANLQQNIQTTLNKLNSPGSAGN